MPKLLRMGRRARGVLLDRAVPTLKRRSREAVGKSDGRLLRRKDRTVWADARNMMSGPERTNSHVGLNRVCQMLRRGSRSVNPALPKRRRVRIGKTILRSFLLSRNSRDGAAKRVPIHSSPAPKQKNIRIANDILVKMVADI